MKKKLSYLITSIILIVITLTSCENKIYQSQNNLPPYGKKNSVSSTSQNKERQLLSISQTVNLGMPTIKLYPDTIYTSYAFNDGLFNPIPNGYEDRIISFHLPKGYMAVFAENNDGSGESACFIAAKSDINANLPPRLHNNISYIRYIALNNPDKKGAAFIKDAPINALNAQWFYGWSIDRSSFLNQQFVPMTWGKTGCTDSNVKNLINRKDIDHLLSFNEPDGKGQSNIQDFDTAIARYKIMLKTGLRLGSPATTQDQAFRSGKWLPQFMAKAKQEKLRVDFIALHWYDWGNQNNNKETNFLTAESVFKRFVNYIERVHETYPDKPLWITEFNANVNRTSEVIHQQFMQMSTEWMNSQDYIERYAFFFERNHPVINTIDSNLTVLGANWKSISSPKSFKQNLIADATNFKYP